MFQDSYLNRIFLVIYIDSTNVANVIDSFFLLDRLKVSMARHSCVCYWLDYARLRCWDNIALCMLRGLLPDGPWTMHTSKGNSPCFLGAHDAAPDLYIHNVTHISISEKHIQTLSLFQMINCKHAADLD